MGQDRYKVGDWVVEPELNRISNDDGVRQLEPKAMDVLARLIASGTEVVSIDELLDSVWAGRVVEPSTVHRRINQIRQALGDDPKTPKYVKTIAKRGYQLLAHVHRLDASKPRPLTARPDLGKLRSQPLLIVASILAIGLLVIGGLHLLDHMAPAPDQLALDQETVLVVLPFKNLSGAKEQKLLADSLTHEIGLLVSNMDGLAVISSLSAARFAQTATDIRQAKPLLGADFVLEGTVNRSAGSTRVNITLTESDSGTQVWASKYQNSQTATQGLFALYDKIANKIGLELRVFLDDLNTPLEFPGLPTTNLGAYEAYRTAFFHLRRGNWQHGLVATTQAIKLDPEFARAHNMRGSLISLQAENGITPAKAAYVEAMRSVDAALNIDPEYGLGWFTKAYLTARLELDFTKSMQLLEHAESLGARKSLIASIKSELFLNTGRYEESLAHSQVGERLDPLNADAKFQTARVLQRMGRIGESRQKFDEIIDQGLRRGMATHYTFLHLIQHDVERATTLTNEIDPSVIPDWVRPRLAFEHGDPEPLKQLVQDWIEARDRQHTPAGVIAAMLLRLGDVEGHINWVAEQEREHSSLHFLYDNIYGGGWTGTRDYWGMLDKWATNRVDRVARLREHRALLDRVMSKMVLPLASVNR